MNTWALAVNCVVAVLSGTFSLLAVIRPERLLRVPQHLTPEAIAYARMYAVRQLPLTIAILVVAIDRNRCALVPLLLVAGSSQLGDAVLGASRRDPGMLAGGTVAGLVHIGTLWHL